MINYLYLIVVISEKVNLSDSGYIGIEKR
jgi:hypothetical protein